MRVGVSSNDFKLIHLVTSNLQCHELESSAFDTGTDWNLELFSRKRTPERQFILLLYRLVSPRNSKKNHFVKRKNVDSYGNLILWIHLSV